MDHDALASEVEKRPLEESGGRFLLFVRQDLGVGRPGTAINADVGRLPPDAPLADAVVAMDPVADALDLPELFGIQMEEATGFGDLIALGLFFLFESGPFGQSFPT